MNKQRLEAGELFAVPGAACGVFGLTKVIFVSAYYKNLMLIRLFEVWIEDTHLGPATEEDMRTLPRPLRK